FLAADSADWNHMSAAARRILHHPYNRKNLIKTNYETVWRCRLRPDRTSEIRYWLCDRKRRGLTSCCRQERGSEQPPTHSPVAGRYHARRHDRATASGWNARG